MDRKQAMLNKILYDFAEDNANSDPKGVALITERFSYTNEEAFNIVGNLMCDFAALGIRRGDLIGLRAEHCVYTVLCTVALGAMGAVSVLTDSHFGVQEYLKQTRDDIRPKFCVTSERGVWEAVLPNGSTVKLDFKTESAPVNTVKNLRKAVSSDDAFQIIFTSGSTGRSKAVVLSHKNCVANPTDAMPLFEQNKNDIAISLLPLNHVFGFAVAACAMFCGHPLMFPDVTDRLHIIECIEKYRVSVIYSVPTFFMDLTENDMHKKYDISSLRLGLMAGGPFTANQMRHIEDELGLKLMPGYGMSECVGISTMKFTDSVEDRASGVGRLYPMTTVKIIDDNGDELPSTETGEIIARGPTLMLGYYNDIEATKTAIDGEGFIHTGDIGRFDEKGILHITGRKKDIIIRGGENLSIGKIEQAILSLDGVLQAAVVAVKDARFGETPAALIRIKSGCGKTAADIKSELKNSLTKIEIPSLIDIVSEFPLTASGKPDKLKIAELLNAKAARVGD